MRIALILFFFDLYLFKIIEICIISSSAMNFKLILDRYKEGIGA